MYFITCFEKLEKDKLGWLNTGASRTFGYYKELKDAKEALNNNSCDMHEYLYKYAIVEEIGEGIHYFAENRWFFEYDDKKGGFFEIEEPAITKNTCNFALG